METVQSRQAPSSVDYTCMANLRFAPKLITGIRSGGKIFTYKIKSSLWGTLTLWGAGGEIKWRQLAHNFFLKRALDPWSVLRLTRETTKRRIAYLEQGLGPLRPILNG